MRWVEHVASMGRWETLSDFLLERLKGRCKSQDRDVDVRILKRILVELAVMV